mmetsp:Transcript_44700/g.74596  ORF Transcript_44700/g.74596 Transcript_44700/m.74596 type:complete len:92 (-) Transcript_44700:421-696(-)
MDASMFFDYGKPFICGQQTPSWRPTLKPWVYFVLDIAFTLGFGVLAIATLSSTAYTTTMLLLLCHTVLMIITDYGTKGFNLAITPTHWMAV